MFFPHVDSTPFLLVLAPQLKIVAALVRAQHLHLDVAWALINLALSGSVWSQRSNVLGPKGPPFFGIFELVFFDARW